jgi:hypothetical protein
VVEGARLHGDEAMSRAVDEARPTLVSP